ncbi:MAG: hypothetical protein AMJ79_08620 [Phycisphaerae bacterium SM23_30]|nr:MAG: hypothetical protein AMJ79_08620 [Phycisphaerae bacterium SM23_30]
MKKIVVLFAVFALAAPVYAQDVSLNFKTELIGGEIWVTVSYDATAAGKLPRGFAFDMQLDNGATFEAIDSYKENVFSVAGDKGFGVYLDTIFFGPDPNTIDNAGSPVAVAPDALPGIGSDGVTICMASLWDPCDPANAPDPTGDLFRVRVSKDVTALTCTEDDDTRGGVVFEDGTAGGLDAPGFMVAWGYPAFAYGNGNGDAIIDGSDFLLMLKHFKKQYGVDPVGTTANVDYNPACDFNFDGLIDGSDFLIMVSHFKESTVGVYPGYKTWPPGS